MKAKDLKELSLEELRERNKSLQEGLFNLRFQHGTNQLENPMRMKLTKRDIARVKTEIGERERAAVRSEG